MNRVEEKSPRDPADAIRRMAGGFAATQMLVAAVKLGLADRLQGGARSAEELAAQTGANTSSLVRFLRMLVVLGLVEQTAEGRFALAEMGEFLLPDHPQSLRDRILYIGEVNYRAASGSLDAILTGEPAFDRVFGRPLFDFLSENVELGRIFSKLMSLSVQDRIEGIIATVDFSAVGSIADIGGGDGSLLKALLRLNPAARGLLFDAPKVISEARIAAQADGFAARIEMIEGDFFADSVPAGADRYVLSNILHDWDDDRSVAILSNCRAAMQDNSRLLIIEEVMPTNPLDAPATVASDFSMMLLTGGRERTEAEYRTLLRRARLDLVSVVPVTHVRIHSGRRSGWAVLTAAAASETGT